MQFSIIQAEVLDQLRLVSTDTILSSTTLKRWINMAMAWALAYKKWPFLEYKGTDLIDSTATYPYPTRMKTKSAFLITVAGKRFEKIRYEDYLRYFEDEPNGEDKVWAEWDRDTFINANACSVGDAVCIYGQQGVADMTADADTTPFDSAEPSGDEAIIKMVVAKGIRKASGDEGRAKALELEAKDILNNIFDRISEAMPREVRKNTPLFRRINILKGTTNDSSSNNVGKF